MGSAAFSVRMSGGQLYVSMAGRMLRKLRDLIVWSLAGQVVAIVREVLRIAYVIIPVLEPSAES